MIIKNRFTGEVIFEGSTANLNNANLSNADLRNTDLRNTDLWNANLSNADLWNADLWNANLTNANLSACINLDWSCVGWSGHGECGRVLSAVKIKNEIIFYCGGFMGNEVKLRKYIDNGDEKYKKSRTKAMNFVLSCFEKGEE